MRGLKKPSVDSLIAVSAAFEGLTLVTRNVRDMANLGIPERKVERMTTFGHMLDYIDRQSGYRPCDDFTTRAGATSAFL